VDLKSRTMNQDLEWILRLYSYPGKSYTFKNKCLLSFHGDFSDLVTSKVRNRMFCEEITGPGTRSKIETIMDVVLRSQIFHDPAA